MDDTLFHRICEAILFASPEPVKPSDISRILDDEPDCEERFLSFLIEYAGRNTGLQILEVNHGYILTTRHEMAPFIRKMQTVQARTRLSRAACEVLAVIAYRQPVTQPEIEHIRGVDSSGVIKTLIEKQLITILGRKPGPGKPMLYGTTGKFLVEFGLKDIQSLPDLEDFAKLLEKENSGPDEPELPGIGLSEGEPSNEPSTE